MFSFAIALIVPAVNYEPVEVPDGDALSIQFAIVRLEQVEVNPYLESRREVVVLSRSLGFPGYGGSIREFIL